MLDFAAAVTFAKHVRRWRVRNPHQPVSWTDGLIKPYTPKIRTAIDRYLARRRETCPTDLSLRS